MHFSEDLLYERLVAQSRNFHKVVDFNPSTEKLIRLNFTEENNDLINLDIRNIGVFSNYINKKLESAGAKFAIGGYNENRILYKAHELFNNKNTKASSFPADDEPRFEDRTVHLGIDMWGKAGTKVYAPLGGLVHSFAFNNNYGDYGATIILMHQMDSLTFYTLYGHLSLDDIAKVSEFQYIVRGHVIGHFGGPEENGYWPPHLHFQVIKDVRTYKGDYPGVCVSGEREKYLSNCPDPDAILGMMRYL
ncbi:MAG: peptidoglycan DD-metalloendopeptidase family protein [Ginsengibacter sp.]